MFNATIKTATDKQSIRTVLSMISLLTMAASVSATGYFAQSDNPQSVVDSCYHQIQTQVPSYRYQSTQQHTMDCMLTQLQAYQQSDKTSHQRYLAYKAQAWLTYAIHQDSMNSRAPAGKYAAQTAELILQALHDGTAQNISLYQDIPEISALMRPDLWATLTALKRSNGIESAPRELAFSEVSLIWAATNQCKRGWRESSSHFRMANHWLDQAREAYVNAHESQASIALEALTTSYYNQYAPLDTGDDVCRGQSLTDS